MSAALEHIDAMGGAQLQIWNNAAYDDCGDSGGSVSLKKPSPSAWYPIPAVRHSEGLFHAADKENQGVDLSGSSPAPKKTPAAVGKSVPLTPVPAQQPASARKAVALGGDDGGGADDGDIDAEIKEVEKEIGRLTLRLETLRLQKAEKDSRAAGRRGRIVPAKFLKPKTSSDKNDHVEVPASKRVLESPASAKYGRRGASLGPLEIINAGVGLRQPLGTPGRTPVRSIKDRPKSCILKLQGVAEEDGDREKEKPLRPKQGTPAMRSRRNADSPAAAPPSVGFRRGASLGPSEIATALGSRRPGKKLHEINEAAAAADPKKGRGRSLSSSPKSRQTAAKLPELRKGIATIRSEKPAGREKSVPAPTNLRPKTLFQDAKKQPAKADHHHNNTAAPKSLQHGILSQHEAKKPACIKKPGKNVKMRTVASRYSLITVRVGRDPQEGKRRKWSLPDSGKDDERGASTGVKKYRMSMPAAGQKVAMGSQWDNPDQIDEEEAADPIERSPPSLMRIAGQLPKIRTIRCDAWSPRDSGRAKRVAELVGREKSHFDAAVETEVAAAAAAATSCEGMDVGEGD